MGPTDSNDRSDSVPERPSWHNFVAVALALGAVGIVITLLMTNSYYTGIMEGLSMLPVSEVRHEQ
jgi:hypothetical protein